MIINFWHNRQSQYRVWQARRRWVKIDPTIEVFYRCADGTTITAAEWWSTCGRWKRLMGRLPR